MSAQHRVPLNLDNLAWQRPTLGECIDGPRHIIPTQAPTIKPPSRDVIYELAAARNPRPGVEL